MIRGMCMAMCPLQEMEMREREKLLHPVEILYGSEKQKYPKSDPFRTVKCFSRSAAGIDLSSPDILRPTPILLKTIQFLLREVINDCRFSMICKYDFIVDRMRAIQQDMVIQSLSPNDSIKILEPIVLFHCLYGYRLCTEKISQYDPVLNRKHLLEYLKRLLVCYDEENNDNLINNMKHLTLDRECDGSEINRRILMEAIYIMCNLGNLHPLERYLGLPQQYKNGYLKTCYEISICHLTRNWVRECYLMKHQIPPLALCAGILCLPDIRRTAYQVMCQAYNSKILKYPVNKLKEILLYENEVDLIEECNYYNIEIVDQFICFQKESFKFNNETFPLKKLKYLNDLISNDDLLR